MRRAMIALCAAALASSVLVVMSSAADRAGENVSPIFGVRMPK
jgi:hypothetical protein